MANVDYVYLCLSILIAGLTPWVVAAPQEEHGSCQVWDRIARKFSTAPSSQQTCWSNGTDPCTRIDCSGAFDYNAQNTLGIDIGKDTEVDYCAGIILNHCDHNISLDFYIQVPAKRVDKTTRVYHNSLCSVPGLSFAGSTGKVAQGYLYFEMARRDNTVTFSVTVKVSLLIHGVKTWPSDFQKVLISNETVPVPPCTSGTPTHSSKPLLRECHPPSWKRNQNNVPAGLTGDLGKLCNETKWCSKNRWLACNRTTNHCTCKPDYLLATDPDGNKICQRLPWHGRRCLSQDDCISLGEGHCMKGLCQCKDGYTYKEDVKTCQSVSQSGSTPGPSMSVTETGKNAVDPHKGAVSKNGQSKVAVIAGAVIGGLVVLAGILVAAYFAIRRLRRPYHNRQLLLEGEDGDGIM